MMKISLAKMLKVHFLKKCTFLKPRNVIGLAKALSQEEMENLILTHIEVTEDDLRELAKQRAKVVREYLLSAGQLDAGRIFLVEPKVLVLDNPGEGTRKPGGICD